MRSIEIERPSKFVKMIKNKVNIKISKINVNV